MSNRNLLCFDISSGGVSATLFTHQLEVIRTAEAEWEPSTLSVQNVVSRFKHSIRALNLASSDNVDAICIGTFMHNCVLLDASGEPLTPVFTWLDRRGETGLEYVRSRLGDRFHEMTGCRYHPMFPVFKLAMLRLAAPKELFQATREIVSIKALLINRLTGTTVEDRGTASASGLFNVKDGDWDAEILSLIGIERSQLPPLVNRNEIVGSVTSRAASEFGLGKGTLVVAGSGDGFLANVGSGCEDPTKIAVTLGTSAVARQALLQPVLNHSSGTFCYRADASTYLLGCAGSNGGNVLDWGRQNFGNTDDSEVSEDIPIFIPLLHGERSPEWDPLLRASWHGLTAQHTAADLSRSILEGVIFNLAHFIEIVTMTSGEAAARIVLSGNGFLNPLAAPMLAAVAEIPTDLPRAPGLMSLRGAAICALRALALPVPPLHLEEVSPLKQQRLLERYHSYRRLRASAGASVRS